jgi:GNAT superfamily N-acetyltransferase
MVVIMNVVQRNVYVHMERDHLGDIPTLPLPEGYSIRWYASGDERAWTDIHLRAEEFAEITAEVHPREFGRDGSLLASRQCFLLDARHSPIATATAWFDDDYHGRRYGRVHWVAVVPEHQGLGLSKPLLTIVLQRMVALGHDRAYLRTSTARLAAINLYAQFGFRPALRTAGQLSIWKQLNPYLRYPFDLTAS